MLKWKCGSRVLRSIAIQTYKQKTCTTTRTRKTVSKCKPIVFRESQSLKIGVASELDHRWWPTHENLYLLGFVGCEQTLGDHVLGNKSSTVRPPLVGWVVQSVMKLETIRVLFGNGFQFRSY